MVIVHGFDFIFLDQTKAKTENTLVNNNSKETKSIYILYKFCLNGKKKRREKLNEKQIDSLKKHY